MLSQRLLEERMDKIRSCVNGMDMRVTELSVTKSRRAAKLEKLYYATLELALQTALMLSEADSLLNQETVRDEVARLMAAKGDDGK